MEEMEEMMNSELYVKVLERFDTENLYSLSFSISQFVIRIFVPCALFSAAMAMIIKREPINLQNKNT
jgi:Na+-transporting NADH:ubiquinone oxidoreductase subunit NqrD